MAASLVEVGSSRHPPKLLGRPRPARLLPPSSPLPICDPAVPNRANDHASLLDRVQDAVAAYAGRPEALHASYESLAHLLGFGLKQDERFEDGVAYRVR